MSENDLNKLEDEELRGKIMVIIAKQPDNNHHNV